MPTADAFEWPQGQPLFEVMWRSATESLAGNGIVSNGDFEVTATSTDLQIQVAAGTMFYLASEHSLGAADTHTLSAGDGSNDRWDTVYFDMSTGSSGVREGTPASNPEPPDIQGDEMLLAVVYVEANATDVAGSDILNWRAKFSNEAEETHYDDTTGTYSVSNVAAALDELQEAAQITAYPLAIASDTEADAYPLSNSDIANSSVTVNAGTGLSTTGASIALGGSSTLSITSGGVTLTELANPFALPSISDMDAAGNDLVDGSTIIWDASSGFVPNEQVQALANFTSDEQFSQHPIAAGDVDPVSLGGLGLPNHHIEYSGGLSDEEVARFQLASGEAVEVYALDLEIKGGGTDSNVSIDVYDNDASTVVASTTAGSLSTGSPIGSSGTGATILVRVTTGASGPYTLNASGKINIT